MKLILIIILIFTIMLIANAISNQYKEKYDFYCNLKSFLNQFKINLSFRQESIVEFLNKTKGKKQFSLFISAYKKYLTTNVLNLDEIKVLEESEKEQLEEIVNNIGNFDAQNERKQVDVFIIEIEENLKKAETNKNKLCPLIIKLSLLFAIALAILLI